MARYFQISRSIFFASSNELTRIASASFLKVSFFACRARARSSTVGGVVLLGSARPAAGRSASESGVRLPSRHSLAMRRAAGGLALGDLVQHLVAVSRVADDRRQIDPALPFEPGHPNQRGAVERLGQRFGLGRVSRREHRRAPPGSRGGRAAGRRSGTSAKSRSRSAAGRAPGGSVTSEVAVMASSSVLWASVNWSLAIAPLAIRCKARLRSSGRGDQPGVLRAARW